MNCQMKSPLQILYLEDDPNDAALAQATLEEEDLSCDLTFVQDRDGFVAALEQGGIDLILSDYLLPGFDGMSALAIVRARWPDTPFIFLSGTLGEERAIDSLQAGATDYVVKERLARLAPAVRRAMREVAEREKSRRTELALRETEQRLRVIFEKSPLGILLFGENGRPVLTNSALQKMLGYSGEELSEKDHKNLTHPEDRAKADEVFQQFMRGDRPGYQIEKRYIRKDGTIVWARVSVSAAHLTAGRPDFAIGMAEDITERHNLEAQIIEAQKMEVIGHLASGIAHDFNNMLAVIMGNSDLIIQKLVSEKDVAGCVETIRTSAQRAAGLTRQLLIFSRRQKVHPLVLDLNDVVKEMAKILRRLIDENIELAVVPAENLGRIRADSGYVGQVLMNLAINARDAMVQGGTLTIATSNAALDENYARTHQGALPGPYVLLRVSDTGTGMTDEVKAHIFEAFFTTKPKGKGTGLGLATCQTIVQQSGGYIEIASEVGRGTTVSIYFPKVDEPLDVNVLGKSAPTPRGTETVLVVEDEPTLRRLARNVLEVQGYQVVSASNGQDALNAVRDHKGAPIRLVITDVVMPLMGGKVMAEWLRITHPNLKFLFTSGYTDEAASQLGPSSEGVDFMPKPYTPTLLACKVREMLDAQKEPPRGKEP